jgi:hypothetical protein
LDVEISSDYPWRRYSLRLNPRGRLRPSGPLLGAAVFLVVLFLISMNSLLFAPRRLSAVSYITYPFLMEFVSDWGFWGLLGSILGLFAGIYSYSSLTAPQSFLLSTIYVLPSVLSFLIYRGLLAGAGIDPLKRDLIKSEIEGFRVRRRAAWAAYIALIVIAFNLLDVWLGILFLEQAGVMSESDAVFWLLVWSISNALSSIVFEPILIKAITDSLEPFGLINEGWLS